MFRCLLVKIEVILFSRPMLFSVNMDIVKLLSIAYESLISETEAPVGTMGNTLSSLPTITSSR